MYKNYNILNKIQPLMKPLNLKQWKLHCKIPKVNLKITFRPSFVMTLVITYSGLLKTGLNCINNT